MSPGLVFLLMMAALLVLATAEYTEGGCTCGCLVLLALFLLATFFVSSCVSWLAG